MGKRRQQVRLVGLALALALVAAACGGGDDEGGGGGGQQATPEKGGVLRTAISDFGFTNGFDPTGEYVAVGIDLYGALEPDPDGLPSTSPTRRATSSSPTWPRPRRRSPRTA